MAESRAGDIFKPGHVLNNTYRIDTILGRGGTSEVYKAQNNISGRFVAIKVLKSEFAGDEAFLTLMRREEEIREIRHDAVVRYSENHRTPDGLIYLVMDYVDGPGLDLLLRQGGLPADDLVRVCRRVADGLKLAHSRRIIHRDLSPDNIILKGGNPDGAVIIDFGIAKDANPGAQTIVGNDFAGKYAYAAPEQLAGNTDTRSDLYSLGALLLATYRGRRPDPGKNPLEVLQRKQLPLDTLGVPEPLKSLIDRMSHPDPAQRFQSANELVQAIDANILAPDVTLINPRTAIPAFTTRVPPPVLNPAAALPLPITQSAGVNGAAVKTGQAPSRSGLWLALAALVIVGGGTALYYSGLLTGGTKPSDTVSVAENVKAPADTAPKAPDAKAPEAAVPTVAVEPTTQPQTGPAVPTPETAQPASPQPAVPQPAVPQPVAPQPVAPQPTVPDTAPVEPAAKVAESAPVPALPIADPYVLIVERPASGAAMAVGNVPSQQVADALTQAMQDLGGSANLTLASGALGPTWGADVVKVIQTLRAVDSWHIAIKENQADVSGTTSDPAVQAAVTKAIGTLPGVLKGTARIEVAMKITPFLAPDLLAPALTVNSDCGRLALVDPPSLGYAKGDTITVTGRLAKAETQVKLFSAVAALAPDRKVDLRIDLLNPALCQIEAALPTARQGDFRFDFSYGDTAGENASGRYFVGENPVIDLVIPADVTGGYVSVLIVDVSGNVYHVLPNLNRNDNSVAGLRKGVAGPLTVRIAYPLSDNADPSHIAFTVDATSLGKTKVMVIHSQSPLFPELRPTTESVGGFADGLKTQVESGALQILSLNSRILTSIAR